LIELRQKQEVFTGPFNR